MFFGLLLALTTPTYRIDKPGLSESSLGFGFRMAGSTFSYSASAIVHKS
jgi:hypothetical protein